MTIYISRTKISIAEIKLSRSLQQSFCRLLVFAAHETLAPHNAARKNTPASFLRRTSNLPSGAICKHNANRGRENIAAEGQFIARDEQISHIPFF